jgi:DNA primase
VDRFRLGYAANHTLGCLPSKQRHFAGCLVVPVFDEAGAVVEVYGLKTGRHRKPPLQLCRPGLPRGIWNIAALQSSKEVILCESLIDALTFWCAGYRNVTASYGVAGFTDEHLDAFKRYGTERVLIAYHREEAGDQASSSLAARLRSERIECYRIQFPKGMDANRYALRARPANKSLGLVIQEALRLGEGERPSYEIRRQGNGENLRHRA